MSRGEGVRERERERASESESLIAGWLTKSGESALRREILSDEPEARTAVNSRHFGGEKKFGRGKTLVHSLRRCCWRILDPVSQNSFWGTSRTTLGIFLNFEYAKTDFRLR